MSEYRKLQNDKREKIKAMNRDRKRKSRANSAGLLSFSCFLKISFFDTSAAEKNRDDARAAHAKKSLDPAFREERNQRRRAQYEICSERVLTLKRQAYHRRRKEYAEKRRDHIFQGITSENIEDSTLAK